MNATPKFDPMNWKHLMPELYVFRLRCAYFVVKILWRVSTKTKYWALSLSIWAENDKL